MTTPNALTVYRRSELEDSDCLFRVNKIWREGIEDSSDYSIRGQAFAHIKHLYILRLVAKQIEADEEEANAAFIQGIAEHQTPLRLLPELRELWMRHTANAFTLDLERYVTSEERQQGDGLSWSPDLVYAHGDELEILDDKSWWSMFTEEEARQSFQGRFYVWQARQRWKNFARYRMTFVFIRFNKVVSVVYSQADLDAVELEVRAAVARRQHAEQTNQWPAVAGPSCRFCELACPIADTPVTMPIRLTAEQAPRVAAWVLTADKALKSAKKTLKAHSAAYGAISVGGVEFANRPVMQRSYPLDAVLEVLKKRSLMGAFEESAMQGLTVSQSALSKLFKAYPGLIDDLAPYVQEKQTFRFAAKQAGGDEEGGDE